MFPPHVSDKDTHPHASQQHEGTRCSAYKGFELWPDWSGRNSQLAFIFCQAKHVLGSKIARNQAELQACKIILQATPAV